MASDFHTHHLPASGVNALVSTLTPAAGYFSSCQYHPWHLPEKFSPPDDIEKLAGFHALGEVGLDRLRGPDLAVQQEFLHYFFSVAQDMHKPVVLHIVQCYQELFELIKPFKLKLLLHGFAGSPELLQELWKRNITVSCSKRILCRPEILMQLQKPAGAYGFESDDDPATDVRNILTQSQIKDVETITDRNFNDFIMVQ